MLPTQKGRCTTSNNRFYKVYVVSVQSPIEEVSLYDRQKGTETLPTWYMTSSPRDFDY